MAAVFKQGPQPLAKLFVPAARTPADVADLLSRLSGLESSAFLPCLQEALAISGTEKNIHRLFFSICKWAVAALEDRGPCSFPAAVHPWKRGSGQQRCTYTAAQCRGLLANAFLLNVQDTCTDLKQVDHVGGLDFTHMMTSSSPVAAHKLACLLCYFQLASKLEGTDDDLREVVFERRTSTMDVSDFKHWVLGTGADLICDGDMFKLHDGGMELVDDADSFVNFANANFGYGRFIPSCTQEEIMQMCCPEFNVGMLHQGYMLDDEVVVAHGIRRFSCYTGYGNTFHHTGPWNKTPEVQTILAMDAVTSKHYVEEMVLRDICKAYMCFQGCQVVSTGKWGCGAFGGQPAHKFVQQIIAATLSGSKLTFSTFSAPAECDFVLECISSNRPSASELLSATLIASAAVRERRDFAKTLSEVLGARAAARTRVQAAEVAEVDFI